MKKLIFVFTFSFTILTCSLFAQWQPDVRLTNDAPNGSFTSLNNAWCIASSGNVVHIAWYDYRNSNWGIFYKRSSDAGITWGADTRLTNISADAESPSISVSGTVVHIVWHDKRSSSDEIYYIRSTDAGITWAAETRLTNNSGFSQNPSMVLSGSDLHVVWDDNRDGNKEIYHKRSTDAGVSWGADMRLTNNPAISEFPSVALSGSVVHVVWHDERGVYPQIYYKRSTDGGISWGAEILLTSNTANLEYPSVMASGSVVHVVWDDERDGNSHIYYKRSTDGGVSWGADIGLTNGPSISYSPSVTVSGSAVHVVWFDHRDGNYEIYYKRSTDGGISWETDTRLTNNTGTSYLPFAVVSGSTVHLVWQDDRDGNWEIYYKRNPTGNPIGIHNISNEVPKQFSLLQNYPNPFNPSTNIKFAIPKSSNVKLVVYDITGREVETLMDGKLNAGTFNADWDASNYSSGVYFYKLESEGFSETKRMILLK